MTEIKMELVWIQNLKALITDGMFRTDERWKKIFLDNLDHVNESALSAGQAQPVAIKPLEWEYVERRTMTYTAFWADGDVAYYIDQSFGSDSYYFRTIRWPEETIYDGDDLPSAKAAAQSDYEARILSALVPPAVPGEVEFERLGNINRDVVEQLQAGYSWTTRIAVGEWSPQSVQLYIKSEPTASVPLPEIEGGDKGDEPCPVCGNEERGQGGYLSCECPAAPSASIEGETP